MSKKQAIKAISFLWAGSLVGAGCAFLTQVILARELGPADFGTFSAGLATVTLLTPLAGFGVPQYWLKAFGQEGWRAIRWLSPSLHFVGISTFLVFSVLLVWSILGPHDNLMRAILLVLSVYVFGQVGVELVSGKLQLEERYIHLALWQVFPHLARLSLIMLLTFNLNELMDKYGVALAYATVASILAVLSIYHLLFMARGDFDLKGHANSMSKDDLIRPSIKAVFTQAWPFGLATLFHLIYYQSDIILVKYITGSDAAGVYNVAFTVMLAVYILPTVIFQKYLLPKMHRWANHDRRQFIQVYRIGNVSMLVLGICAMIIIWGFSSWFIPLLFGNDYNDAVLLLNILAVSSPILFVALCVGAMLVTQEHMKRKVKYMGVVAALNIFLNFLLIPYFGAVGAAIATILSNFVLVMTYYTATQKFIINSVNKT